MKIGIVADHRGYILKSKLVEKLKKEYEVVDLGCQKGEKADFTDYAFLIGKKLQNNEIDLAIAICGTGIGMSIALNKMKNVMCAKINNILEAKRAKEHNHANAIAIGAEITSYHKAFKMIKTFINEKTNNEDKYLKRINQINTYQEEQ